MDEMYDVRAGNTVLITGATKILFIILHLFWACQINYAFKNYLETVSHQKSAVY